MQINDIRSSITVYSKHDTFKNNVKVIQNFGSNTSFVPDLVVKPPWLVLENVTSYNIHQSPVNVIFCPLVCYFKDNLILFFYVGNPYISVTSIVSDTLFRHIRSIVGNIVRYNCEPNLT